MGLPLGPHHSQSCIKESLHCSIIAPGLKSLKKLLESASAPLMVQDTLATSHHHTKDHLNGGKAEMEAYTKSPPDSKEVMVKRFCSETTFTFGAWYVLLVRSGHTLSYNGQALDAVAQSVDEAKEEKKGES